MSDRRNIDPEEAAEVTRRIGQAFDFAQDMIDDPSVLQQIPDGSTLRFGGVDVAGVHVRLTASRRSGIDQVWTARVTGCSGPEAPSSEPRGAHHLDLEAVETGDTAEAALEALASRFHRFGMAIRQ